MAGSCSARATALTARSGGGKSASPAPTSIRSTPCSINRRLIAGSSAIGYVGSAPTRLLNPATPNSPRCGQRPSAVSHQQSKADGRWLIADSSNLAPRRRWRRADTMHREELFQLAAYVGPVPDRFRGRRQPLEHRGPIALGDHTPIQQDNGSDIRFGPNQPSESLFQLERRERNEIVGEAIHSRFRETLQPRRG